MAVIKEEIQFNTEHIKEEMDKEHETVLQRLEEISEVLIASLDEERSVRNEVLIHVLMDSFEKLFCSGHLKTKEVVDSSKVQQRFVGLSSRIKPSLEPRKHVETPRITWKDIKSFIRACFLSFIVVILIVFSDYLHHAISEIFKIAVQLFQSNVLIYFLYNMLYYYKNS
ncbi:hypothetical protein CEXT_614041 [Caerostris extrusa]|uniref:Uncharacterized protein n=1 Tax=Caerostris extrusa TaxID=172846 RepID=A0AAV4QUG9_CAEEX|nr:hypothetical protein CEXT_614041 [Caerostris extrusa]